ncbi:MAG: divergent polysaccharide deacetylase family protein, partial [Rhodobacterales bacterium]|nr:divergent polysaccharide deacetylase family protein [Rhodobacterales bacterium]
AAALAAPDPATLAPIDRFARPHVADPGRPAFVVLLADPGGPAVDREALAALPFPVTFVIDPALPDAGLAADLYRAAGQEIALLAPALPADAGPADAEVAFEAAAAGVPQAVAAVLPPASVLQDSRDLAQQTVDILQAQGRGLVSWDRGLNAAGQIAARQGLRSAVVFRPLDAEGEATPVIRRYLDRATFRAAQEGLVIVYGTARPETVAALLEWAVEGRSAMVQFAPLTAVLRAP